MDNLYDEEFVHLPEKLRQLSELKEKQKELIIVQFEFDNLNPKRKCYTKESNIFFQTEQSTIKNQKNKDLDEISKKVQNLEKSIKPLQEKYEKFQKSIQESYNK